MEHEQISWKLVRRAQARELEAEEELYPRIFQLCFNFLVTRVDSPFEAEDLAQKVLVRIFKHIDRFGQIDGAPFQALMYKIVHNLLKTYYKDTRRRQLYLEEIDSDYNPALMTTDQEGEVVFEEGEMKCVLYEALESLTPDQRAALIFEYLDDLTAEQTAVILGKSENSVKSLRVRGKKKLFRLMREYFLE